MRVLRLFLAGALAAVGLVALTPTASHACFCLTGSVRQQVARSDVVFSGTFTRYVPTTEGYGRLPASQLVTYEMEVREVFAGDVASTANVASTAGGGACGLEGMAFGATYLVFAGREEDGAFFSSSCSGTGPVSPAGVAAVEDLTGPGRPPSPDLATLLAEILALFAWPS